MRIDINRWERVPDAWVFWGVVKSNSPIDADRKYFILRLPSYRMKCAMDVDELCWHQLSLCWNSVSGWRIGYFRI